MIVLSEEAGGEMEIGEVGWFRAPLGDFMAQLDNFTIHLGLASSDSLCSTFDENYIPGTRTLVYHSSSQAVYAQSDGWIRIGLDETFQYSGNENLLLEVAWNGGNGRVYTYGWNDEGDFPRSLEAYYGESTGILSPVMSNISLNQSSHLRTSTFGRIKSLCFQLFP